MEGEEEEQQRKNVKSSTIFSDMPISEDRQDLLMKIIERMDVAELLEHQLKGHSFDYEEHKWVKTDSEPLLNDSGIKWVITTVNSYLGVDKLATNLDEEEVKRMAAAIRHDIVDKFYMCHEQFAIRKSDLSLIVDFIDHFVFINLSGSRSGTILNFMKPTFQRIETYKPEEKKGRFSWVPFFGGGSE